jgi:hypothetical protein
MASKPERAAPEGLLLGARSNIGTFRAHCDASFFHTFKMAGAVGGEALYPAETSHGLGRNPHFYDAKNPTFLT